MKRYIIILWIILVVAILKNIQVPNGFVVIVGDMEPPMYLNYFINFFGVDVIYFLFGIYAVLHTKKIIAYLLFFLSIGNLMIRFSSPYGFHWVDFTVLGLSVCVAIIMYAYRFENGTERN